MGDAKRQALTRVQEAVALDTFGCRIHVEWDPAADVTPLWQVPFFIEFLKVSGLFDAWVAECPLAYQSNNAPDKRAVLATFLLSILAGHQRDAHITAIRHDGIHPRPLGVAHLVSEDAARRALLRMEEGPGVCWRGVAWLDRHLGKTTRPLRAPHLLVDVGEEPADIQLQGIAGSRPVARDPPHELLQPRHRPMGSLARPAGIGVVDEDRLPDSLQASIST